MQLRKALIVALLICPLVLTAQKNNTQAAMYNIGTGAIVAGIGAVINKKPDEKIGKVILRGITQGALGGFVVYESKQLIYQFSESGNFGFAWSSKLLNDAGNSIIQNAASNKKFLDTWHVNFGFNRIEISTRNKFNMRYKVMPMALYIFAYSASQATFSFKESAQSAQFVFKADNIQYSGRIIDSYGVAIANSIIIKNNLPENEYRKVLAHEIIHTYQYNDFARINSFFDIPRTSWVNNDIKAVRLYKKWIYTDVHLFLKQELYRLEGLNNECYYSNFFEQEANFYSHKYTCN